MAQFSNTITPTATPKAPVHYPMTPVPKTIFDQKGLLGNLANFGADLGGGVKKSVNNIVDPNSPGNQAFNNMMSPQPKTTPPAPTTPIKSHSVSADGSTKTEYHAPPKVEGATATQPPVPTVPPAPTPIQPDNSAIPSTVQGALLSKGLEALNRSTALTGQIQSAKQDIAGNPNYSLDTQVGRQGLIQQNIGTQAQALAQQGGNYLTAASQATPQVAGYGQTVFNPLSGTFGTNGGGGTGGTQVVGPNDPLYPAMQQYAKLRATGQESLIPGSISGNPALSAQLTDMAKGVNPSYNANTAGAIAGSQADLQNKITTAESTQDATNNNFDTLIDYGTKFDANTPIVTGIKQLFAGTAGGDIKTQQAIAGFQSSLANIQKQYQDLTGADPISAGLTPNVTPAALKQIKQDMKDKVANKLKNYKDELGKIQGGSSNGNPTSSGGNGSMVNIGDNTFTQDANGNWVVKK